MTITLTDAVFTTTITNNEIAIAPTTGSVMTNATTTRLGYTVDRGVTATWTNPIWFRFYEPIAATEIPLGTLRTFQAIDVENNFGPDVGQPELNTLYALLFANYYSTPTTRAAIEAVDTSASPLFQRLAGETPSGGWSTTFPLVEDIPGSNQKSIILFQDFGVGYQLANQLINSGNVQIGTIFKEVHFTEVDPLADPVLFPAKYRYLSSTKQNTEATIGNQTVGMVIHTNLWDDAFTPSGLLHFLQFLAVTPILAKIMYLINGSATFYNPMAYINSLLDATMLQKGQGYFNRGARVDTFYGWFGNSLVSFSNEVSGAPIIVPFMAFNEYLALKNMVAAYAPTSLPFGNGVPCIWAGTSQTTNITVGSPKAYVRLMMLYAAWVQISGSPTAATYIAQTETNIQTITGLTPAQYYQAGANALAVGEYGHFFRFAQTISYGGSSTIFATFIQPYISWQATVSSLQLVALGKVSNDTTGNFLPPILNLPSYLTTAGLYATNMTAGEETALTNYTYP